MEAFVANPQFNETITRIGEREANQIIEESILEGELKKNMIKDVVETYMETIQEVEITDMI